MPLAEKMRPTDLSNMVGQSHLLAKNAPFKRIIQSGNIPNMLFFGPCGVGKTTLAKIISKKTDMPFFSFNATIDSTKEIKAAIEKTNNMFAFKSALIYIDEIQHLNKKEQQSLLHFMETGQIVLIASTSENPYFYIYGAVLSRLTIFEFKPIEKKDMIKVIEKGFIQMKQDLNKDFYYEPHLFDAIATKAAGDLRAALNTVELCSISVLENRTITITTSKSLCSAANQNYLEGEDGYYNLLSALQKSIRGSDENAAIYYLALLLKTGHLKAICRRLLVIAAEDVGLSFPMAICITKACTDSALQLGLKEAQIPLAQATILLATSPKSNSANLAIKKALKDIEDGHIYEPPNILKNKHIKETFKTQKEESYVSPHNFKNHYIKTNFLPNNIINRKYYTYGDNKFEQAAKRYKQKLLNDLQK